MSAEVRLTHPDMVTYGEAFDISFAVDTTLATPSITLAFMTFLDTSDTLDLSSSTWEYVFTSDEPPWNLFMSGVLGDATTPTTHDANGYSSRFFDPINGNYTWLWSDWHGQVEWTLRDVVLLEATTFDLTLEALLAAGESTRNAARLIAPRST